MTRLTERPRHPNESQIGYSKIADTMADPTKSRSNSFSFNDAKFSVSGVWQPGHLRSDDPSGSMTWNYDVPKTRAYAISIRYARPAIGASRRRTPASHKVETVVRIPLEPSRAWLADTDRIGARFRKRRSSKSSIRSDHRSARCPGCQTPETENFASLKLNELLRLLVGSAIVSAILSRPIWDS